MPRPCTYIYFYFRKGNLHAAGFHDDSFILGPADIPLAGQTTEVVEEEIITGIIKDSHNQRQ